jgi:CDP-paratose 2-epimerase
MNTSYAEDNRIGDHIWWISDVSKFQTAYPEWHYQYDIKTLMEDIHEGVTARLETT